MTRTYFLLFSVSVIGCIVSAIIIILSIIFAKKILSLKGGVLVFILLMFFFSFSTAITARLTMLCIKDLKYVTNDTYEESEGEVIEFTKIKHDYDGSGKTIYSQPQFYFADKNEYVVLYARDVEVGETYLVRYYPNTKICEIVQKASP